MPLAICDLVSFIPEKGEEHILSVVEVRDFSKQILSGIAFMHSKGICHRDIKLDNILVFGESV